MLNTTSEALELLKSLGASDRLIRHLELVGEAGEQLIANLELEGLKFDKQLVRLGIAVHDAGKIIHPKEFDDKGSEHEPAGQQLLLEHNVQKAVARCCISHARYDQIDVTFEELLVALSDKLWKGKRVPSLELRVIDSAAELLNKDRWDLFDSLDNCFEKIASLGDERLARSRLL